MRFIDKTKTTEPNSFKAWKNTHAEAIEVKVADPTATGDNIWEMLNDKNDLKTQLVKDQYGICCYCGVRISNDSNTIIEHFRAKSRHKNLTFNYHNLGASCMGGSKMIIHRVQADETIENIANQYAVSIEHLEQVYVDTDFTKEKFAQEYDLENLQIGDRLIIFRKLIGAQQHCDCKKGDQIIDILPTQPDCANYFSYDQNGLIRTDPNHANYSTVTHLGLNNNPYLVQNRKKEVDEGERILGLILNQTPNRTTRLQLLRTAKRKIMSIDENGNLRPYCFVRLSILNSL